MGTVRLTEPARAITTWPFLYSAGRGLLLVVALAACTGPTTPSDPSPAPTGWIYAGGAAEPGQFLQRVSARTGEVEAATWGPAFPLGQTFRALPGMVSPHDGRIAAQGYVGGTWPETFVYQPSTDSIAVIRAPVSYRDVGHSWSPDGASIAFSRQRVEGGSGGQAVVVLSTERFALDTVLSTGPFESVGRMSWVAPDTLLIEYFAPASGMEYRTVAISTMQQGLLSDVENQGIGGALAFSGSGRWRTLWRRETSGDQDSLVLTLADRHGTRGQRRVRALPFDGTTSLSVAFDPHERFFADCAALDELRIVRIDDLAEVRRIPVPFCSSLSWSRH